MKPEDLNIEYIYKLYNIAIKKFPDYVKNNEDIKNGCIQVALYLKKKAIENNAKMRTDIIIKKMQVEIKKQQYDRENKHEKYKSEHEPQARELDADFRIDLIEALDKLEPIKKRIYIDRHVNSLSLLKICKKYKIKKGDLKEMLEQITMELRENLNDWENENPIKGD